MVQKTAPAKKAPAKKAAPKRQIKTAAAKTAQAAPKPKVNNHVEAGLNVGRYDGPSKFVNSNRKVKVMLGREVSNLTDRAASGLYALRDCYGQKAFQPRGFDNGILRDLAGAGLITFTGGQKSVIDGTEYMIDGETPVQVKITSAGMNYGSAKAS